MGQREVFRFVDNPEKPTEEFQVYMHWASTPSGAQQYIESACAKAWPLPRFEPDEFAAAFVAAHKDDPGNVRLMTPGDKSIAFDVEYLYVIWCDQKKGSALQVIVYKTSVPAKKLVKRELYRGPVSGMNEHNWVEAERCCRPF